jgi:dTDP-4-dehydrorhamnose reductase
MTATAGVCVVLGASGLLGQALRREGARRAISIIGMARANTDELVDLTDWPALQTKLDAIRPATVINAAALTNLEACEREPLAAYSVNARVVAFLAGYCAEHAIKLVQVSTDHFFPGEGSRLHDESSPVRLVNEYARTKYAGERTRSAYQHRRLSRLARPSQLRGVGVADAAERRTDDAVRRLLYLEHRRRHLRKGAVRSADARHERPSQRCRSRCLEQA